MAEMLRRIPVGAESELAKELDAAVECGRPLAIDTGDAIYEVFVGRKRPARLDNDTIARSIAGIREAAGSWKEVDIDAFEAYRAERRRVHRRPPVNL